MFIQNCKISLLFVDLTHTRAMPQVHLASVGSRGLVWMVVAKYDPHHQVPEQVPKDLANPGRVAGCINFYLASYYIYGNW